MNFFMIINESKGFKNYNFTLLKNYIIYKNIIKLNLDKKIKGYNL